MSIIQGYVEDFIVSLKKAFYAADSGGISLPKSWTVMSKDEAVKSVVLSTSDPEYVSVAQMFSAGTRIQPVQVND